MAGFPTPGDDVIFGTDADETIDGLAGNDLLFGGLGNDLLRGGLGDDRLSGGLGLDILFGGDGSDTAYYALAGTDIHADLTEGNGYVVAAGFDADVDYFVKLENLTGGKGNDYLRGNGLGNVLTGNAGSDTLLGEAGNDTLVGGNGVDIFEGGAGADTLNGGRDIDIARYKGSSAGIDIDMAAGTAVGGDAGGDILLSIDWIEGSDSADALRGDAGGNSFYGDGGDDVLIGRAGIDGLTGGAGADTLKGGDGRDVLQGGLGADKLTGGAGDDDFVFLSIADSGLAATGRDRVTDFVQGEDKIALMPAEKGPIPLTFIGTEAFHAGMPNEFRYFQNNGQTIIEVRLDSSGGPAMRIAFDGSIDFAQSDFIL